MLKSTAVEKAHNVWRIKHPEAEYYLQTFYDLAPLDSYDVGPDPNIEWSTPIRELPKGMTTELIKTPTQSLGWLF
jgi:hypothetical protein